MHTLSKQTIWRGRFFRYAPLLLWMGVIFLLSSNVGAASNTSLIIRPLLLWLFPDITEPSIQAVQFYVRKTAHFTEYAILASLAFRALRNSSYPVLKNWPFLFSLALVILTASADEFHQGFVASRTSSPYDSLLDTVGGLTALVVIWLFSRKKPEKR
jgi:VanZ family protein